MKEFDLINQIKLQCNSTTSGTILAIGDDAAILQADAKQNWVVSTDTLVADTHFKSTDAAITIGHKSLAVSFSDVAAMGATPKWVLLNLTLPKMDTKWNNGFIKGFAKLLQQHQAQLIGGDTTQGPLSITVTVIGETTNAITRSTAQVGDLIVVSGQLGSAAFALNNPRRNKSCNAQLKTPEPRLDVANSVRKIATSMTDISDGLLADLGHICHASGVAAVVELTQIPINSVIEKDENWMQYVLAGGDDYQLCFTIDINDEEKLPEDCHIIGQIIAASDDLENRVVVLNQHQPMATDYTGFEHFSS